MHVYYFKGLMIYFTILNFTQAINIFIYQPVFKINENYSMGGRINFHLICPIVDYVHFF